MTENPNGSRSSRRRRAASERLPGRSRRPPCQHVAGVPASLRRPPRPAAPRPLGSRRGGDRHALLPADQGPGPPPADRAAQPLEPRAGEPRAGRRGHPQGGARPDLARRWSRSTSTSARQLVGQVLDEIFGLGPLEPLMQDPEISDILVNTYKNIFIERHGRLEKTDVRFQDDQHLLQVIDRIVSAVGRRIDDSSPMVDARLPDGSRVNAIIKPLALDGPHLSIRKFRRDALAAEDLLRYDSATEPMVELLQRHRQGAAQHPHLGRHRRRQDDAAQHPRRRSFRPPSGSSRSRTRPSFSSGSRTWCGWRPGRPTSRARARCPSACC